MAVEVVERGLSRDRLASQIKGLILASGGRIPVEELRRYLRKRGFDPELVVRRLEDMGLEARGMYVVYPPVLWPQTDLECHVA